MTSAPQPFRRDTSGSRHSERLRAGAKGATRLLACPALKPIEALTLTFLDGQVHAALVVSDARRLGTDRLRRGCGGRRPIRALRAHVLGLGASVATERLPARHRGDRGSQIVPGGQSRWHIVLSFRLRRPRFGLRLVHPTQPANPLERQKISEYALIKVVLHWVETFAHHWAQVARALVASNRMPRLRPHLPSFRRVLRQASPILALAKIPLI